MMLDYQQPDQPVEHGSTVLPLQIIKGTARLGRVTKSLARRVRASDIAVIEHRDLDDLAADALIAAGVRCILNADLTLSGRYQADGAARLLAAGIPVIDDLGCDLFSCIHEGDALLVDVDTGSIWVDGGHAASKPLAQGRVMSKSRLATIQAEAAKGVAQQLDRFLDNTLRYAHHEKQLLLNAINLPPLSVNLSGRHVLIVVRGSGYKADLLAVGAYVRDVRPVIIAVDGGADAVLDLGWHPDVILGDMDSVSDKALHCGAELLVHAYPNGEAPGMDRLQELQLEAHLFPVPGTSEDAALLLAHEAGAELIVAVGTHSNMLDFLAKGREGMASTMLTRLKVGPRLVDAKGVNLLYCSGSGGRYVPHLMVAAFTAVGAIIAVSPFMQGFVRLFWLQVRLLLGI